MPQEVALECLYSTVRNSSNQRQFFGFLPPHGIFLNPDEEYHVFGDIRESVVRDERALAVRLQKSLENALDDGVMEILKTPAPILYDAEESQQAPKMLVLVGGQLAVVAPCWETELAT
jgi:hypothetical protein